ncbi:MAG: hypothetical protein IT579_12130, partial [Verrucomicrobia subdivision 3 bacterium]|nr:hypothetical protein [Limisphaerales bacterium]
MPVPGLQPFGPLHVLARDLTGDGLKPPNPVVITGRITAIDGPGNPILKQPWKPCDGTVSDGSGAVEVSGLSPSLPFGAIISVTGAWDGKKVLASEWTANSPDWTHYWSSTLAESPPPMRPVTLYGSFQNPQKTVARGQLIWQWREMPAYAVVVYGGEDGSYAGTSETQANGWALEPQRVELDITVGGGETVRRTFVAQ